MSRCFRSRETDLFMRPFFFEDTSAQNDVVIHLRCGDILSAGGTEYGLSTTHFYQHAATLLSGELTANSTVYLLSQLSNASARLFDHPTQKNQAHNFVERDNMGKCDQIVHFVAGQLKKVFAPASVVIVGNGTANEDFLRMVHAPNLIWQRIGLVPTNSCLLG